MPPPEEDLPPEDLELLDLLLDFEPPDFLPPLDLPPPLDLDPPDFLLLLDLLLDFELPDLLPPLDLPPRLDFDPPDFLPPEDLPPPEDFPPPDDFDPPDDLPPLDFPPDPPRPELFELLDLDPEDFELLLPPLDLLPPDDFLLPPPDLLPPDDFVPPDFLPPPDFELPDDLPPPMPTARVAAPATWLAARFAPSTFCGFVAALPAMAPITPPTTAPTGPATLPTTAPAAAPAWVLETDGMFSLVDEDDSLPEDCCSCSLAIKRSSLGVLLVAAVSVISEVSVRTRCLLRKKLPLSRQTSGQQKSA